METMTLIDFEGLQFGDTVHRVTDGNCRTLRFVARMPGCSSYYIFCDGEYLTYFHTTHTLTYWYKGKYDSKEMGNIILLQLKKRMESIKKVYFK